MRSTPFVPDADFQVSNIEGWEGLPGVRESWSARPNAHGVFDHRVWAEQRVVTVSGWCHSREERDALFQKLGGMLVLHADVEPLTIRFAGRTLTADARLTRYQPKLDHYLSGDYWPFTVEWVCPDPLRYGPDVEAATPMPTASGGLQFDLFTDGEGANTGFLEFGELSEDGRIVVSNGGTADAWPVFRFGGPILGGVSVRNRETGNVLRYTGDIPDGSELVIDTGTGRVLLDGVDRSVSLTVREWTPVPAGSSREFVASARSVTRPAPVALPPAIPDAVSEWWLSPTVVRVNGRVFAGGIAEDGGIVVASWAEATGAIEREVVGQAIVDDHNAPSVWASEGRRIVVAWTNHAQDSDVHLKVSDRDGSLVSLVDAEDHVLTIEDKSLSYTHIIHRPSESDADTDVFWMINRTELGGAGWSVTPFTVDQGTGAVSWGSTQLMFESGPGQQMYVAVAAGVGGTVRLAVAHNPAELIGTLWGYELDVESGDITNVMTGATVGNVVSGVGLPVFDEDQEPVLEAPASGRSRRLFYPRPGPAGFAIAFAEWDTSAPDGAVYHVAHVDSGQVTVTDHGVSGPRVGYTAAANYIGGMAFPVPCDGRVVTAHSAAGRERIIEWTPNGSGGYSQATLVDKPSVFGRLIRPMGIVDAAGGDTEYAYTRMRRYSPETYRSYAGDIVFLAPEVPDTEAPEAEVGVMRVQWRDTSW